MFIGTGWDIHRHTNTKSLKLGGLSFDEDGFELYLLADTKDREVIEEYLETTK